MEQIDPGERKCAYKFKSPHLKLDLLHKDNNKLDYKEGHALKPQTADNIVPSLELNSSASISPRCRVLPGNSLGQLLPRVKRMRSPRQKRSRSFGSPRTGTDNSDTSDISFEMSDASLSDYET